jgi:hypothetical protein
MQILLLRGELRYLALTLAIGILLGSAMAWMVQETYGAIGSAWAAFVGRSITVLLIASRMIPILRSLPWRDYLAIPVSAAVMGFVLWLMPADWPLFARILLGGLTDLLVLSALQRDKLLQFVKALRQRSA